VRVRPQLFCYFLREWKASSHVLGEEGLAAHPMDLACRVEAVVEEGLDLRVSSRDFGQSLDMLELCLRSADLKERDSSEWQIVCCQVGCEPDLAKLECGVVVEERLDIRVARAAGISGHRRRWMERFHCGLEIFGVVAGSVALFPGNIVGVANWRAILLNAEHV